MNENLNKNIKWKTKAELKSKWNLIKCKQLIWLLYYEFVFNFVSIVLRNFYKTTKCNACQRINVLNATKKNIYILICKTKKKPSNNKKFNKAVPNNKQTQKRKTKNQTELYTCLEIFCVPLYTKLKTKEKE